MLFIGTAQVYLRAVTVYRIAHFFYCAVYYRLVQDFCCAATVHRFAQVLCCALFRSTLNGICRSMHHRYPFLKRLVALYDALDICHSGHKWAKPSIVVYFHTGHIYMNWFTVV